MLLVIIWIIRPIVGEWFALLLARVESGVEWSDGLLILGVSYTNFTPMQEDRMHNMYGSFRFGK